MAVTLTACAGGGDRTLDEVADDMVEVAEEFRDGFVALEQLGPNEMAVLLDTNARLWDEAAEITPGEDGYAACADLFRDAAADVADTRHPWIDGDGRREQPVRDLRAGHARRHGHRRDRERLVSEGPARRQFTNVDEHVEGTSVASAAMNWTIMVTVVTLAAAILGLAG